MSVFKTIQRVESAVDMAIALKQHLVDCYSRAREGSDDPVLRDIFSFLAAEQERLLGLYRQFLDVRVKRICDEEKRHRGKIEEYKKALEKK